MKTVYQGYQLIQITDILLFPFSIFLSYHVVMYISKRLLGNEIQYLAVIKKAFYFKLLFCFAFFIIIFTIYSDRNDQMGFYFHLQQFIPIIKKNPLVLLDIFLSQNNQNNVIPPLNENTDAFISSNSFFSILKIELLLLPISFNSFLAINVYGTYLGFIGLVLIFTTFLKICKKKKIKFHLGIFFVPTVNFYTCGVVKEGLAILLMGIIFYFLYNTIHLNTLKKVVLCVLILFFPIGFYAKPYIFLIFIPSLFLALSYLELKDRSLLLKSFYTLILLSSLLLFVYFISNLDERFLFANILDGVSLVQEYTLDASSNVGGKGNFTPIDIDISSIKGIFTMTIEGLLLAFFRPYFWEAESPLFILVGIENLALLHLFINKVVKRQKSSLLNLIIFFIFVIPFSIFVAISNGNFGALLRYKSPMMPFLFTFLLLYEKKRSTSRS